MQDKIFSLIRTTLYPCQAISAWLNGSAIPNHCVRASMSDQKTKWAWTKQRKHTAHTLHVSREAWWVSINPAACKLHIAFNTHCNGRLFQYVQGFSRSGCAAIWTDLQASSSEHFTKIPVQTIDIAGGLLVYTKRICTQFGSYLHLWISTRWVMDNNFFDILLKLLVLGIGDRHLDNFLVDMKS